jgi:hypothetical protein
LHARDGPFINLEYGRSSFLPIARDDCLPWVILDADVGAPVLTGLDRRRMTQLVWMTTFSTCPPHWIIPSRTAPESRLSSVYELLGKFVVVHPKTPEMSSETAGTYLNFRSLFLPFISLEGRFQKFQSTSSKLFFTNRYVSPCHPTRCSVIINVNALHPLPTARLSDGSSWILPSFGN